MDKKDARIIGVPALLVSFVNFIAYFVLPNTPPSMLVAAVMIGVGGFVLTFYWDQISGKRKRKNDE